MAQQPLKSEKKDRKLEGELSLSPEFDTAYDLLLAQNYIQAAIHLKAAAEQGYPPAFLELHSLYNYGRKGVPKDSKQASHWLAKSAQFLDWYETYSAKGDWRANACLGYLYVEGLGVKKDVEKSLLYFDAALKQQPNAVLLCSRGTVLGALGRHAEALAAYDAVLAINPQDAIAHYGRACVLYDLGRHAEALAAYDASLAIDPQHAVAHCSRGTMLGILGRHVEALAAYDASLAIDPQHAVAHCSRGTMLGILGRHVEALAAYDAALAIDPQRAIAHYSRGKALHALGRHTEALAMYDTAIAIGLQYAGVHYDRGRVLHDLGQHTNAINAFLAALAINENLPGAKLQLLLLTGMSYKVYKAKKMRGLNIKLAEVAGEIGMFKRDEEVQGVVRMGSQAEKTQLPEDKKAQSAIKTDSQTETNNLLKIILDYAVCPPENEDPQSKSSCCIS
jgi:tetratricopeptide (TPR) repeat protein